MTMLTCPTLLCPHGCMYHVAVPLMAACSTLLWPLQLHTICHPALTAACTVLLCPSWLHAACCCALRSSIQHVATPFIAAYSMSLCPSQQHTACRCALHGSIQHVTMPFVVAHSMLLCLLWLHTPHHHAPFTGLPSALDQTHMGSYILMLNSSQVVSLLFYLEYICISQTFANGAHAPVHAPQVPSCGCSLASIIWFLSCLLDFSHTIRDQDQRQDFKRH